MLRAAAGTVVVALDRLDEVLDEVLYRPAIVRAFRWIPRWWLCDFAKASHLLSIDDLDRELKAAAERSIAWRWA